MEHRVVLKTRGDNVLFAFFRHQLRDTFNRPVVRLTAARSEINLVRLGV